MSFGEKPRRSRWPFFLILFAVATLGTGYAVLTANAVGGAPKVDIRFDKTAVGQATNVEVIVSEPVRGIVDVVVEAEGAGLPRTLLGETHIAPPENAWSDPATTETTIKAVVGKASMPVLTEGTLTIRVTATLVVTWLRKPEPIVVEKTIAVKLTPPLVTPMSSFVHVAQGGAEVIVYEVGATTTQHGVVVERIDGSEPWVFPGFDFPGGPANRKLAFFALPYDDAGPEFDVKKRVKLFAADDVDNRSTASFIHKYLPRPMPTDTINLNDRFLEKVTTEIFPQVQGLERKGNLLEDYLVLNRELRRQNRDELLEIAKRSKAAFLWREVFMPFDNASVKGAFADRRTYRYQDKDVDTQDHLGFDLARVERTPVNAANDGVVVNAGYFGIYGNCVIIDHGFGIMSLYAHLSSIDVSVDEPVKRGQTLGRTGATGMAGGDHLHFTMLVHGRPSNPIEWWDAHWIADRLKLKLGPALPFGTAP